MNWQWLKEDVILITTDQSHDLADAILSEELDGITDVVAGDHELAVQFTHSNSEELIRRISDINPMRKRSSEAVTLPVCYELGMDWDEVCSQARKSKEEIIDLHLKGKYRVRYGFTPGFIYLNGLDVAIHCKRKSSPRSKLPAGSVGIGGDKTGIYSLESPGGWQIIGLTPTALFDISRNHPFKLENGASVKFKRITSQEYHEIRASHSN